MRPTHLSSASKKALAVASVILAFGIAAIASTETTLYSFAGGSGDGAYPIAGLVSDKAGNFYGMTFEGGGFGACSPFGQTCGVIFELSPNGNGGYTETVIHTFTGGTDGGSPYDTMVIDASGNLYGTTYLGGTGTACPGGPCGVVFELSPPVSGQGSWTQTVLHSFSGGSDGAYAQAGLILVGNKLFGTTNVGGGTGCAGYGCGTVFRLTNTQGGWQYKTIYRFQGSSDGGYPYAGLAVDKSGNLYGTTNGNGLYGAGTVYELKPGTGSYTETTLYSFTGGADGGNPVAPVILGPGGTLFGTTNADGSNFFGTVFQLHLSQGVWTLTTLHTFTGGNDGGYPSASLLLNGTSLYGTSWGGGNTSLCFYGCGAIFQLTKSSSGWTFNTLYTFQGSSDGGEPDGSLLLDQTGNLYSTTILGGSSSQGVVFELTP